MFKHRHHSAPVLCGLLVCLVAPVIGSASDGKDSVEVDSYELATRVPRYDDMRERVEHLRVVFVGRVLRKREREIDLKTGVTSSNPRYSGPVSYPADSFVVHVERTWQGIESGAVVGVVEPQQWAVPLRPDRRYLFFANWNLDSTWLYSERRTGTKELELAKSDLRQLRRVLKRKAKE